MPTTEQPTTITLTEVATALAHIGIPSINDITRVEITPDAVTAVHLRRDSNGRTVAAGGEPATITTVTAVTRDEPVGVIQFDGDITQEAAERFRAAWQAAGGRPEQVLDPRRSNDG